MAERLAVSLDYVGVLALELFVMKDGRLYQKTIGTTNAVKDMCKELGVGKCK